MVMRAEFTVERLLNSNFDPKFWKLFAKARGILIFSSILKAGFIFGAEGGSGVLLARTPQGGWSYPAFHSLGAASLGIQIGVKNSQVVLLVMTERSLRLMLGADFKLGVDGGVAFLSKGFATGASPDLYAFALSQGAFLGVSFEGAVISPRNDLNKAFYGRDVSAEEIVLQHKVANPFADGLRKELSGY
jgi:lipid-binding SYLF domain-containing protein